MAELETTCCAEEVQASCCEREAKSECCGDHQDGGCGCSSGAAQTELATAKVTVVRETVREKYAAAASAIANGPASACCSPVDEVGGFGSALYADTEDAPQAATSASLGCGVPTAIAD